MVQRIHHVNFLVRDLDAAIARYERILNMPVTSRDQLEERGVAIARFLLGDAWLILVQPVRPDTVPARHLEAHGEGFFLLSFAVDDLDAEIDRLGATMFDGPKRRGLDDWQVIDIDAAQTFDAQLQLVTSRYTGK